MNVRFSKQAVRVRVAREEFEQLTGGRALNLELVLPRDHVYRINVRSSPLGGWQLESDPTGLWLTIPRAVLEELAAQLPSKEGVAHTFDTNGAPLELEFEVDVKKPRGAKQPLSSSAS